MANNHIFQNQTSIHKILQPLRAPEGTEAAEGYSLLPSRDSTVITNTQVPGTSKRRIPCCKGLSTSGTGQMHHRCLRDKMMSKHGLTTHTLTRRAGNPAISPLFQEPEGIGCIPRLVRGWMCMLGVGRICVFYQYLFPSEHLSKRMKV